MTDLTVKVRILRDYWDHNEDRHKAGNIEEIPIMEAFTGVEKGAMQRVDEREFSSYVASGRIPKIEPKPEDPVPSTPERRKASAERYKAKKAEMAAAELAATDAEPQE